MVRPAGRVMQVPWMKWYPADWRSETTLRMVGREARSLWVDLLGIMHEADGFLLIGGLKPTLKQLSQILGDPEEKIAALLHELQTASVCSINDAGVIYSRRMVKDRQKSAVLSQAGKAGGNPRLKPTLKPTLKPSRARDPETRDQIPEDRNQKKDSVATQRAPDAPPIGTPLDLKRELWARAIPFLQSGGIAERDARSMVGKWRRDHGDVEILNALAAAEAAAASEPVAYVQKVLTAKGKPNGRANVEGQPRSAFDVFADGYLNARADRERSER